MKKEEIWANIPQYDGIYQVSNLGRVRSLKFNRIRILKPNISTRYSKVSLCKNNIKRSFNVHKLVAIAFLNNKPDGTHKIVVDHIDGNPSNNHLDNLQLISNRENLSRDKVGSSKYTGVSWNKQHSKWCSYIGINGRRIYLGLFDDEEEAGQIYQSALSNIDKYNGNIKEFREKLIYFVKN